MEFGKWKLGHGIWKMEIGTWKLENGNWKIDIGKLGNWKIEIGKLKLGNQNWAMVNRLGDLRVTKGQQSWNISVCQFIDQLPEWTITYVEV